VDRSSGRQFSISAKSLLSCLMFEMQRRRFAAYPLVVLTGMKMNTMTARSAMPTIQIHAGCLFTSALYGEVA
jgi:hypothetical protein